MQVVGTLPAYDQRRWVAIIGPRGYKYPPGGAPPGNPREKQYEAPTPEEWERCRADRAVAYRLVAAVVQRGGVVVSGLALGIDAAAHAGALAAAARFGITRPVTVAVVNVPPGEPIYPPENRALAERIRTQGCTLHPFLTGDREREAFERACGIQKEGARLPSVFTRRLWEQDYIIAALCSQIFCVDSRPRITGGTAWGCGVGRISGAICRAECDGQGMTADMAGSRREAGSLLRAAGLHSPWQSAPRGRGGPCPAA